MTELKALNAPDLTEETLTALEKILLELPGLEQLKYVSEKHELCIVFNEHLLPIQTLAQFMRQAGCPLNKMGAVIIH